ncbi:hypothetical protein FNV43_RR02704 [Rhamnella rubrinervis]|uniref:Uncharacterized protein n=1 Tax=Rhamnella rubrinervis TaxID=2594499 RepID=A0A8K0MN07_9ROSA|nr:hypothetical protein FNV43_RR02704 [Rhamnella rubrinervis]
MDSHSGSERSFLTWMWKVQDRKVHSAINVIHFPISNLPNLGRAKLETCPESRRLGFPILGGEGEAKPINISLSLIAKRRSVFGRYHTGAPSLHTHLVLQVSDGLHDGLWRSKIRYKQFGARRRACGCVLAQKPSQACFQQSSTKIINGIRTTAKHTYNGCHT